MVLLHRFRPLFQYLGVIHLPRPDYVEIPERGDYRHRYFPEVPHTCWRHWMSKSSRILQ